MSDFTPVPTVVLLTRAADAAGKAADLLERWAVTDGIRAERWRRELEAVLLASGPDHWRAVEATFRAVLAIHGPIGEHSNTLRALRPLAEQVLRDLGQTT